MSDASLRFLADESCDFAVVRVLRSARYDVFAVSEVTNRSNDAELMAQAAKEKRILLTEDKDFGWLFFVSGKESEGVVLIRFPGNARETLAQTVLQVVHKQAEQLKGVFVVIQPGYVRISRKLE